MCTIRIAATAFALTLCLQSLDVHAAYVQGTRRSEVLIGVDDDNQNDPEIQSGPGADQSLDNADVLVGDRGDDVLIGMLGSDVLLGGPGADVLVGGIEGGQRHHGDNPLRPHGRGQATQDRDGGGESA